MSYLNLNSFAVVVPDYELQAGSLQLVATPRVEILFAIAVALLMAGGCG